MRRKAFATWILLLGVAPVGACSSTDAVDEQTGSVSSALAPAVMAELLGFEDPTLWSSTATLSQSTTASQGRFSMGITGANFNFIDSPPLSSFSLSNDSVTLDVRLPANQPNPWWFGDVQMYADAPSAGVYNQYIGYAALTGLPTEQFTTLSFTLPPALFSALSGGFSDLVIRLALNVPFDATGTTLFDNLVFGGVSADSLSRAPIALAPEPVESGVFVYLPLAPHQAGEEEVSQLAISLGMTNQSAAPVLIQNVELSFSGGAVVPAQVLPVGSVVPAGGFFRRNTMMGFASMGADELNENVFLPQPTPTEITIRVYADGFGEPAEMTLPMAPYEPPTPSGAWRFWGNPEDVADDEFWQTRQGRHPSGVGELPQIFALDVGMVRYVDGQLSGLRPGTDGSNNSDWWVWNKPIRAIGDGVVHSVLNGVPTNPVGTSLFQVCTADPTDPRCLCDGSPCPMNGSGNHVYVQHGDDLVLYAHFDLDSIPGGVVEDAPVVAGQLLGLVGNSGNSSGPHLHIHSHQTTNTVSGGVRPLPFSGVHAIEQDVVLTPNPSAAWSLLEGQGFPRSVRSEDGGPVFSLIWPSATHPD